MPILFDTGDLLKPLLNASAVEAYLHVVVQSHADDDTVMGYDLCNECYFSATTRDADEKRKALEQLVLAAMADPGQAGEALARQILERPANDGRVGTMHFELINAAGRTRSRAALMAHSEAGREVRVAIYFTAPAAIQDTAFLSHDRPRAGDADRTTRSGRRTGGLAT